LIAAMQYVAPVPQALPIAAPIAVAVVEGPPIVAPLLKRSWKGRQLWRPWPTRSWKRPTPQCRPVSGAAATKMRTSNLTYFEYFECVMGSISISISTSISFRNSSLCRQRHRTRLVGWRSSTEQGANVRSFLGAFSRASLHSSIWSPYLK
jgi:hypothetical protein